MCVCRCGTVHLGVCVCVEVWYGAFRGMCVCRCGMVHLGVCVCVEVWGWCI